MKLSVLIPYRSDGARRDLLFAWVLDRYQRLLPDAEIVIGTNDDEPFNRGAARNDAYRQSTGDILVVADADVVCDPGALWAAAALVVDQRRWVLPYRTYYNLDEATSNRILASDPTSPYPPEETLGYNHRLVVAVAGQLVMPRAAFEEVDGYDERYVGWGYEDTDFALALETLWAPAERLNGLCLHLWHPVGDSSFEQPMIKTNVALHRQYASRQGNERGMRELIRGRHL